MAKMNLIRAFEDYNFNLIFENHGHTLKITKPLLNNVAVSEDEGVIYVGDGAWSVSKRTECKSFDKNIMEEVQTGKNFVWIVYVNK